MSKFLEFIEQLPSSGDIAEPGKLLAFLEGAHWLGLAFFDDLLVCQWATPAFSEISGRQPQEIVGAGLQSLFPGFDADRLRRRDERAMQTGSPSAPQVVLGGPPQSKMELVASASPLWNKGEFYGVLVVAHPAPDAGAAQRAHSLRDEPVAGILRQMEDDPRVNRLLNLLETSFLLLDSGGRAEYISPKARQLFRLNDDAAPIYSIANDPNFERPETASLVKDALEGQETHFPPVDYYTEIDGALGKGANLQTTLAFSLLPIEDAGGRPILCLFISQPTLTDEVSQSVTLMQRSESVAMLARGVAHEFNNIFAAIKGIASLLQSEADSDSSTAAYLQKVNGLIDRGVKLITNLTSYARLHEPRVSKLIVQDFFDDFASLIEFVVPKDVKLELSLEAEGSVEADPNSLRQALFNIVQNSFEAMADTEKKLIRLEVSAVAPGDLPGGAFRFSTPSVMLVSILDSGPGIPADLAASIFEPYFSTKDPQSSSGLGLNVTQQIIRRLGGVILAERTSKLGGAAFRVYLPLHKES
ncbi:PAS domain-containing protein [bacterium]|nr:PAS domain-containing protein [bacterium]